MSLKNFTILFSINILLTILCIASIYFLWGRSISPPESIIYGLLIFFVLGQFIVTFKILKARAIFSGTIFTLCIVGIFAIWLFALYYMMSKIQC